MKKRIWSILLILCMALTLLPTSALADAIERPVITNYEELVAAENSTETYYFIPKAEFGWPEEETEVSITADLRMSSGGSWVIPEQATVNLSGKLQQDRSTPASVTVNGTLNLLDKMVLSVHQITIAGTLMVSGTSVTIGADEGEALSTATFNLIPVTDTTHSNLVFYQGPKYTPTHWVFHEGVTFLGADPSKYSIGDFLFRDGLFETDGAVRSQYALTGNGATLKGDWIFSQIGVHGNGLTVEGSVSCRYSNASAGLTIPEGSTFAVELWEEAPGYSSSLNASRSAEILVNGTLRMGRRLNVKLDGNGPIVGTGVVDARANNSWGNQQPVFLVDGTGIKVDDIDRDRAAYADLLAESLTIQKSWATRPALTKPASVTVNAGEEAVFSVEAKYTDSYQWCYKTSADSTESFPCTDAMGTGANTNTFRLIAKPEYDGYVFFCWGYNSESSHSSAAATLTVLSNELSITGQPVDVTAAVGESAVFSVSASGSDLTYQWQYNNPATGTWKNSSAKTVGYNTDTLQVEATAARNGYQYRCVVTDASGNTVTSNAATLTVQGGLAITTQPASANIVGTNTAAFKVVASGTGLTYQWQYKNASGVWKNCSSATTGYNQATLTVAGVSGSTNRNGYQYRCVITDASGKTVTSDAAKLTVFAIKTQPKAATAVNTGTAAFKVAATGSGLRYQWQYKNSSGVWKNCSSATKGYNTATLTVAGVSGTTNRNGYQYRCVVTDANGNQLTSNAAKLTVFAVKTQPVSATAVKGSTATFKVVATGSDLTYQWQYKNPATGVWKNSSSATNGYNTATLNVVATAARNGYQYRCIVKDANGNTLTSNAATLTVM